MFQLNVTVMQTQSINTIEFERPQMGMGASCTAKAWARVPAAPSPAERAALKERIKRLLKEKQTVLVAHYYVDADLQDLAEETGGCVSDSLEMARFGRDHPAQTLVVAGVKFMGETAKILSPEKRVLMPDLDATCSLDLGCPADEFGAFCDAHPDRTVVVYANTSAAVKARADWMVTSSIGLDIVAHLHAQGKKILWAPDKHLGGYIQKKTGADMLLWQGSCLVHDEFKAVELDLLKREHPRAKVLAHPESPEAVVALAVFKMVDVMSVGPIPTELFAPWIMKRAAATRVGFDRSVAEAIIAVAGARTRDVVQLARHVWDATHMAGHATLQDVSAGMDDLVREQSAHHQATWHRLKSDTHRRILILLAKSPSTELTASSTLRSYRLGSKTTVSRMLKTLITDEHVVEENGRHHVDDPFFRRWIEIHAFKEFSFPTPSLLNRASST